jgi:hypothetical protein
MLSFNTMPSVGLIAVVISTFFSISNAHMYLSEPKPIPGNAIKDPLDASGSNFPVSDFPLQSIVSLHANNLVVPWRPSPYLRRPEDHSRGDLPPQTRDGWWCQHCRSRWR